MESNSKKSASQRLLVACFVILCLTVFGFSYFVSDRSKSLREGGGQASRTEVPTAKQQDRLIRDLETDHRLLSDQEYVAAAQAAEQQLLERFTREKRNKRDRFRQNRVDARLKWDQEVAQLRSDIQYLDETQPNLSGDLKRKLKRMLADSPR